MHPQVVCAASWLALLGGSCTAVKSLLNGIGSDKRREPVSWRLFQMKNKSNFSPPFPTDIDSITTLIVHSYKYINENIGHGWVSKPVGRHLVMCQHARVRLRKLQRFLIQILLKML
jgi:hypothetical protein